MKGARITARRTAELVCLGVIFLGARLPAKAEELTNAIHAFLQQRIEVDKAAVGMAVGLVDETGTRMVCGGKADMETGHEVDGDTVFDISFLTKTFTAVLLEDEIEQGAMNLDDPVARFLPGSIKMPRRNGHEITLRELATRSFGLPDAPGLEAYMAPTRLERKPRNLFDSAGMALLGQIMARKAGTDYESLVVDRICRPLGMDSTRVTLTPELQARCVGGYDRKGQPAGDGDAGGLLGRAGLHSTANDMVKYVSSLLGLTLANSPRPWKKRSAPTITRGHSLMMGWHGRSRVRHGGQLRLERWIWAGPRELYGMDPARRRGVVILSNSDNAYATYVLGMTLLESDWRADHRPQQGKMKNGSDDSNAGQYEVSPSLGLGLLVFREYFHLASKAWFLVPASCWLAVLLIVYWRAGSFSRRCVAVGGAILVTSLLAMLAALMMGRMACSLYHPGISIRRDGDRLFAQGSLECHPANGRSLPCYCRDFRRNTGQEFHLSFCRSRKGDTSIGRAVCHSYFPGKRKRGAWK